ncbi:MAG: ribulose-phosphate 3-epimerase [Spirochaetaceae bacterium 4572_7]|nr:MAG: ribulose-phosphate 3-epimerase [Spirochaetaceae bacterium 4572_7]
MNRDKDRVLSAPSVLSANFANMEDGVKLIEKSGGDWVHLDVMDGSFVPVITFGPKMIKDIRPLTDLIFDVHLMIDNPGMHIDQFAAAGADYITIHYEAATHINRVLQQIKDSGCKCGISLVPSTPVSVLENILPFVDLVLIMSVNPGFGGQSLIDDSLLKIKKLVEIREEKGLNYLVSIDGGVNKKTAHKVISAGVDVFVAGSAFFGSDDPKEELIAIKNS